MSDSRLDLGVMVKTWLAASVGSSPTTATGTWGLIPKRVRTVASFTGRVNVSLKEVPGEAKPPLV